MSLSFVKEGDDSVATDSAAPVTSTPIDTRPLAVILQANREAKEAAFEAKLKAMNQQLTLTDDDLAFLESREQAQQDRLAAAAQAEAQALAEFRLAVSERVLVTVTDDVPDPAVASASATGGAAVLEGVGNKKRSAADMVAPPIPVGKTPLVAIHQPAAMVVKKKARTADVATKPPVVSAGLSLLGSYAADESDSS
jgi:hypothetical protein